MLPRATEVSFQPWPSGVCCNCSLHGDFSLPSQDLLAPWLMKRMGHRPSIDHNPPQPGEPWQNRRGARRRHFGSLALDIFAFWAWRCWMVAAEDLFWLVRTGAPAHLYPWWTRLHEKIATAASERSVFNARNLVVGAASGLVAQTAEHPDFCSPICNASTVCRS